MLEEQQQLVNPKTWTACGPEEYFWCRMASCTAIAEDGLVKVPLWVCFVVVEEQRCKYE
jgi:hypothetical protein